MLSIKTDLDDVSWLKYIVSQFKKINLLEFDIEVIGIGEKEKFKNIVFYTNCSNSGHLNIFNSQHNFSNTTSIKHIKDDLFILNNTDTNQRGFDLAYDIFWNAFVFLSRYEEYTSEMGGKNIGSYSLRHPRQDKDSFDIPIVNILFNELEYFLHINFKDLVFGKKQKDIIDLSHDVDYIEKTIQLKIKQTVFNAVNVFRLMTRPVYCFKKILELFKFAFSNTSYWCFDDWVNIEKKYNRTSTFYVYVKGKSRGFRSWLIDPSYDIKNNVKLQKKLIDLYKCGFQIGLHGSYNSAINCNQLQYEKDELERILGIKIVKTRQHWLNYSEDTTPDIHNRLFLFDSTLGWNDRMGFRSGIASMYNPYDFKSKKAYDYEVIPQVIMDSNIYDYGLKQDVFNAAKLVLNRSKKFSKTTCVSISWHQRVCSSDYNWHLFYEELLSAF
ncbi:DUF7033 domain-containing protein [Campylobacter concisus]|jgi:hypothetical protein|uniref:DUF7033 domain-containing protein n=1 Tax=Campylobacter concisus TaxID=199 RepID=UPI00122CF739|nr:hypothetical protein [Campylobacter concisus]